MNKENNQIEKNKKEKKPSVLGQSFRSKAFRNGSYSLGVTVLVLVVLIVVNLLADALPVNLTHLDLSPSLLYTIGDTSKEYLAGLEEDVNVIVVAESDTTDDRILNFLDNYAALSDHIHIQQIDPILHPEVLTNYEVTTDNLVVTCKATGRSTNIPFSDIIVKTYNQYYYQQYGQYVEQESEFDGEGQLTSAIDYVTSTVSHQMYTLTGHNEAALGSALSDLLSKSNITVNTLDLMAQSQIPEDCEILVINGASTDLNADEAKLIIDYLAKGGNVTIALGSPLEQQPNLESVLNEYGLQSQLGYATDTSRYYTNSFEVFPVIQDTQTISSLKADTYVLLPMSGTVSHKEGVRGSIEITDLLTTSENGYLYMDADTTEGPDTYILGAAATETVGNVTANLLVFGSSAMLDATVMDSFSNIGNASAYIDCISNELEDMNNISIPAKSIQVTANTVTNGLAWGILFMAVIPVLLIGTGFVIWFRRRRR